MTPPRHAFHFIAMATTFTVTIAQEDIDETYASQAANAVRMEVERLEEELSRFKPSSEIWRLSLLKPGQRSRVTLATWDCLALAKAMHEETHGAFDITVGPLMRLWRLPDGSARQPLPGEIEALREQTGSHLFDLHEEDLSITVHAADMVFDLGALGKGYALDQAVNVLNDWSIHRALLNAGDSTLLALDPPPSQPGWLLHLDPQHDRSVTLNQRALSGSGFAEQGEHIMDPRTLHPVPMKPQRRYALAPTAALADALSTTCMILSDEEILALGQRYPDVELLLPQPSPTNSL
jgi:thiamine biosynthesis lipoprotein